MVIRGSCLWRGTSVQRNVAWILHRAIVIYDLERGNVLYIRVNSNTSEFTMEDECVFFHADTLHELSWTDVYCCVSQAAVAWWRRKSSIVQECVDNVLCITSNLKYLSLASIYLPFSLPSLFFHKMSHGFICHLFFLELGGQFLIHSWSEFLNTHLWNL